MNRRVRAALAAVVMMAPGCALKTPPDAAALRAEGMSKVAIPERYVAPGAAPTGMLEANWIAGFKDDQLTAAIIEAIRNNPDLAVAAERVQQAMLRAKQAGAKLYPSVDVLARGGTKLSGDNSGMQGALLTANWELDLWGRVRYGRAAATADAEASRADFEFARQSIAAVVARNWMLATEAALQAEIARATIREGDELIRLAETRARIGVGNSEEVYIARATIGSYRDALREIELGRDQAVRGLELLLGRYPAAAAAITATLPNQPEAVPAGLPSALLERRPDVIAAERRVAAAFHRVGEAKAARLPAIALTSGVSSISSDLFELKDHSNPVWNLGANLVMPLFRGGALKTQVEIRTAEQRQAVAAYASIGLRAFGDVETALAAESAARDREGILAQTLADNQRAFEIVQTQYRVGSTDLRYVTQRQLAVNATQAALIRMQAEQRIQRVNLYLALGGGY
jgi:NodT family efflux transporter outer membrane factor (OMF) lipoprotein